jgi:hypothetical protein
MCRALCASSADSRNADRARRWTAGVILERLTHRLIPQLAWKGSRGEKRPGQLLETFLGRQGPLKQARS